jgi:hypothetical protein
MCMMLYMATSNDQPLRKSDDLRVEEVEGTRQAVRQWLSLPSVRFVGAHTHCSCGFPSITSDEPFEYFDGIFRDAADREADLRSLRLLIALVREHVIASGEVQLYDVWNGEEGLPPKGTIDVRLDAIDPERFFFNERFLYRVTRDRRSAGL